MTFYKNWATFKYDSNNTVRTDFYESCSFIVNKKTKIANTLKQSMTQAVQLLPNKVGVFYSGGIDSEIIILEMLQNNIKPTLYFIDFKYNYHDKEFAIKFCNKHKLKLNCIDIDIDKFLKSNIFDYVVYGVADIATPLNFYARSFITEDIGMISGVGDPPLYKTLVQIIPEVKREWAIGISENSEVARYFYYKKNYPNDIPLFYRYTPELIVSYLLDKDTLDIVKNEKYKLSIKSTKHKILKKFYDIEDRPKYTGFENIDKNLRQNTLLELQKNVLSKSIVKTYDEFLGIIYDN